MDLAGLNPQQREAVETLRGPVLILAGAGTGKTRVITHRIAWMIRKGIAPDEILAVTFTNKAAREMLGRVNELVPKARSADGERPKRPTICTFHSLCVRILRRHIGKLGYKPSFTIYDDTEQLGVMKRVLANLSAGGEKTDARAILSLLSRLRNAPGGRLSGADPSVLAMAEHLRGRYESALRAANAVDFDDLILLVLRLFRGHADALEACRAQHRYVMVDEYQDTNAAQFELVHALAREHRNLCVVGDDDQSIYGWRGAEVANLLDLEKHFPEVKVVKLEQNYRSTNTILRAANAVITHNPRRRGKQLWSARGDGRKIRLIAFPDDEAEAKAVVDEIRLARLRDEVPWGEHAILFRTNQQSRPLETALRQAAVRYRVIGGQSFFDRLEVRDLVAYLKLLANPDDDAALLRVANVPPRGLSDATLERVLGQSHERHCSVFAALRHTDVPGQFSRRTQEAMGDFVALVETARAGLTDDALTRHAAPLAAWAGGFLQATGYFEHLRRSEKDAETGENRVRNVQDAVAALDAPDADPRAPLAERLHDALAGLALDQDRGQEKETGDAVTLITMHSCKGLEFPHVFIVGLEDGLLPHSRSKAEGTLDEERRLFYVALTRAMRSLVLTHCGARKRYGQMLPCHPSPFLRELPPELVEEEDANARKPVAAASGKEWLARLRESLAVK